MTHSEFSVHFASARAGGGLAPRPGASQRAPAAHNTKTNHFDAFMDWISLCYYPEPTMRRILAAGSTILSLLSACNPLDTSPPRLPPGTAFGPNNDAGPVLDQSAKDLNCPRDRVTLLQTYNRRALNASVLRYLIEGCGQRALYGEMCGVETCAYLLASRFSFPSSGAGGGQ